MANQEDLQEDKHGSLREEFHQLLVPLIRKCWLDKPTDVGMYCARYFQTLVEERHGISISENESENLPQVAFSGTDGKAGRCEAVAQVQESTSLPILIGVHRDRLPLRETSSWSSPADSSSLQPRLWDASYDVADALSRIGDQPAKNGTEKDFLDAEKSNSIGPEKQFFVGDEERKGREVDLENYERNDDSSILKQSESSVIDKGVSSPVDSEVEGELRDIVSSASSSEDVTPGTTYRKRWSSIRDSYLDLALKSEFTEATEEEEEFDLDSNSKQWSPKDDTTESPSVSSESTSTDASLGFVPRLQELASSARTEQSPAPFIQKEVEDSVSLISQSLEDLVKVLDSIKVFCNEHLRRVKTLSDALPEKSLRAPRKKRSVTTFSSSDDLFQSEEFSRAPENKPTAAASNKGCSKTSKKLLKVEFKNNDSVVESDLFGSGFPLKGKMSEEELAKHEETTTIEENNNGTSCASGSSKRGSFLDQNKVKNGRNSNEDRVDFKDTCMDGKPRCREGIVNRGFVIDDSELYSRNHRLGHLGQNLWHANGYRRSMFNEQSPFSQIRIPRPSSIRNANLTRHQNRAPRERPSFRFSYIGEGGDVFSTCRRYRSVGTETDSTQARIRAIRIPPIAQGSADQESRPSEQVKGESSRQVSERDLRSLAFDEQPSKLREENPVQTESIAENVPAGMGEEVEARESRIEIKPAKKSSSLNPCAECFQPPSKIVRNLEPSKSPDETDSSNSERGSSDIADVPTELSIKSLLEAVEDWDYEMFLDDVLLEDQEPILFRNPDFDGRTVSLTIEEVEDEPKFDNEVCATERGSLAPEDYSYEENRLLHGPDGAPPCEKTGDCKKHKRKSDMKLAEGDQGLEGAEEGPEGSDSAEKREEPGLSSACGDFVAVENNVDDEENSGDELLVEQEQVGPPAIAFGMGILGFVPLSVDDDASQQSRRQEEEMELNFACFSGSDSSEFDSSDFSEDEDEFSGENDENKLEEKA